MEVSKNLAEKILKTLPIGYYTGRSDITVELDEKAETSYYNPMSDEIHISLPGINQICKNLNPGEEAETFIRSNMYHEISHSLLTPKDLKIKGRGEELKNDIMNVFEDERIETIFKDFFYGVNFKRNIILLNGWKGEEPQDAFGAFYHTVRFRSGKGEHLNKVNELVKAYWDFSPENSACYSIYTGPYYGKSYRDVIYEFFLEIAKDWLEKNDMNSLNKEAEKYDGGKGDYGSLSEGQKNAAVRDVIEKQQEGRGKYVGIQAGNGKGEETEEGEEGKEGEEGTAINFDDLSEEEQEILKKLIEEAENQEAQVGKSPKEAQKIFDIALNHFVNNDLTNKMKEIIDNFCRRQHNDNSCIARYSGVLNPRLVGAQDWRIFEYVDQSGPIKGYDKLHLNLFIDVSGSFRNNEEQVNTILKSLSSIESEYKFFEFDLVTCQVGEEMRTKRERYIQTGGGNDLDNKIFEIYRKLQNPSQYNYNIILFDGDAFTDCRYGQKDIHKKNFAAFNHDNCYIISDDDNKAAIEKNAPNAHSVFVNRRSSGNKSYSSMLNDNILEAMHRVLL